MEIKEELPVSCLEKMNFKPCPCKAFLNPVGKCYEPPVEIGEGYYWYYAKSGMYTVAVMDIRLKQDYMMDYQQPDFISLNYYDDISAEELLPPKQLRANCIRGHVGKNGECFRAIGHKDMAIRGSELMLMPGYYHDYLATKYPNEFSDPKSAFESIDGCTDFPELVLLLKQISKFQGSGMAADLYYDSKVAEAVSLIIERTKRDRAEGKQTKLQLDDQRILQDVQLYIEEHLAQDIKTEQLAAVACMGQTKLRATFKQAFGQTITEYIQQRRLSHAEELLLQCNDTVGQVAEAVGYRHAGRFSSLFKKQTGLFPDEYRRMMR